MKHKFPFITKFFCAVFGVKPANFPQLARELQLSLINLGFATQRDLEMQSHCFASEESVDAVQEQVKGLNVHSARYRAEINELNGATARLIGDVGKLRTEHDQAIKSGNADVTAITQLIDTLRGEVRKIVSDNDGRKRAMQLAEPGRAEIRRRFEAVCTDLAILKRKASGLADNIGTLENRLASKCVEIEARIVSVEKDAGRRLDIQRRDINLLAAHLGVQFHQTEAKQSERTLVKVSKSRGIIRK